MNEPEISTVFVANLAYDINADELQSFFDEDGITASAARIITDKASGQSRGYGFIDIVCGDIEQALALDGKRLANRRLTVKIAARQQVRTQETVGVSRAE
jgi:RNA recognition motif-containing protein